MALLLFLLLTAACWALGALQLWPRARALHDAALWLGSLLAVCVAACIAWGFVGVFRYSDWQGLSVSQTVRTLFGAGTSWFQRTGWMPLDRIANAYLSLDVAWTILVLCAAALYGHVHWADVSESRRRATLPSAR